MCSRKDLATTQLTSSLNHPNRKAAGKWFPNSICFPTHLLCLFFHLFFVYFERKSLLTSHILLLNNCFPSTIPSLLKQTFLRLIITLVCMLFYMKDHFWKPFNIQLYWTLRLQTLFYLPLNLLAGYWNDLIYIYLLSVSSSWLKKHRERRKQREWESERARSEWDIPTCLCTVSAPA